MNFKKIICDNGTLILSKSFSGIIEDDDGKKWFLNGKQHREDGPAIEYISGTKQWRINGNLHREDGPAIVHFDGNKFWYKNGKQHREDGPAVEWADGNKRWYLDGNKYTEEEFNDEISGRNVTLPSETLEEQRNRELQEYVDNQAVALRTDEYNQQVKNMFKSLQIVPEEMNLTARFVRIGPMCREHYWEIHEAENKNNILLNISVNELAGGKGVEHYDKIYTREFGKKMMRTIRSEGLDKAKDIFKSSDLFNVFDNIKIKKRYEEIDSSNQMLKSFTLPDGTTAMKCINCSYDFPDATANQDDGGFKCWSCKG